MERVSTGVELLDDMLGGGIPANSVVLVAGRPGAGKTILSQQVLFRNARKDGQGLYLSTVGEPAIKVLEAMAAD